MEEREQRKRGTMEALSNERMYILLKHNREMMLELNSLLPNDEELLEGYKAFQETQTLRGCTAHIYCRGSRKDCRRACWFC